jgi:hypothetical protein
MFSIRSNASSIDRSIWIFEKSLCNSQ